MVTKILRNIKVQADLIAGFLPFLNGQQGWAKQPGLYYALLALGQAPLSTKFKRQAFCGSSNGILFGNSC